MGRLLQIAGRRGFPVTPRPMRRVVITPKPLTSMCRWPGPVRWKPLPSFPWRIWKRRPFKNGFLGLRTLTVLRDTIALVRRPPGKSIRWPPSRQETRRHRLLCSGLTQGIFQLESSGMRRLLVKWPRAVGGSDFAGGLYRPGPWAAEWWRISSRRATAKRSYYLHPSRRRSWQPTYGIILYQEQVMQICHRLGGFTLAEAVGPARDG